MIARRLTLVAFVVVLGACKRGGLAPMYCEGGVVNGEGKGGQCLMIDTEHKPDSDPATLGTLKFEGRFRDTYTIRRLSHDKYDLLLGGVSAGTLEQNGTWVTLTFPTEHYSLRSDAPGFLQ